MFSCFSLLSSILLLVGSVNAQAPSCGYCVNAEVALTDACIEANTAVKEIIARDSSCGAKWDPFCIVEYNDCYNQACGADNQQAINAIAQTGGPEGRPLDRQQILDRCPQGRLDTQSPTACPPGKGKGGKKGGYNGSRTGKGGKKYYPDDGARDGKGGKKGYYGGKGGKGGKKGYYGGKGGKKGYYGGKKNGDCYYGGKKTGKKGYYYGGKKTGKKGYYNDGKKTGKKGYYVANDDGPRIGYYGKKGGDFYYGKKGYSTGFNRVEVDYKIDGEKIIVTESETVVIGAEVDVTVEAEGVAVVNAF